MKMNPKRAANFVAVVNGHHIYRDGQLCDLWTSGVGWWGFALSEPYARRTCETVAPAECKRELALIEAR